MVKKVSESMSMEGHSCKEWLVRNKKEIKNAVAALLALASAALSGLSAPWAVALMGVVGLVSKYGLDALDFYLSEVELE